MEKKSTIPSLDDIAFEGRNKEYGAYFIRKGYKVRLASSLIISVSSVLLILFLIIELSKIHSTDYYLNPKQNGNTVQVDNTDQPYGIKTMKSAESKSSTDFVLPKIVPTVDQISNQSKKTDSESGGNNDSTAHRNGDSDGTDSASIAGLGDGVTGEVYGSAEVYPQFPGGEKAMQQFIRENLHYPEIARVQNITGAIHIYFVIQFNGIVRDVKVIKGLQPDLDNEAVRVIRLMPLWKPGIRGGIPVNVRCIIPITVSPLKYK